MVQHAAAIPGGVATHPPRDPSTDSLLAISVVYFSDLTRRTPIAVDLLGAL